MLDLDLHTSSICLHIIFISVCIWAVAPITALIIQIIHYTVGAEVA